MAPCSGRSIIRGRVKRPTVVDFVNGPSPFFEPPLNISSGGSWQSFLLFQPTHLILRMFRFPFPHSPPSKKHFPFLPLSKLNKAHGDLRKTKSGAWQSVGDCNFLSYPVAKIRLRLSHIVISTPQYVPFNVILYFLVELESLILPPIPAA